NQYNLLVLTLLLHHSHLHRCYYSTYLLFYSLSLHDALPICYIVKIVRNISLKIYWRKEAAKRSGHYKVALEEIEGYIADRKTVRSEEHTSEIQSRFDLVCRLLLEKKN